MSLIKSLSVAVSVNSTSPGITFSLTCIFLLVSENLGEWSFTSVTQIVTEAVALLGVSPPSTAATYNRFEKQGMAGIPMQVRGNPLKLKMYVSL